MVYFLSILFLAIGGISGYLLHYLVMKMNPSGRLVITEKSDGGTLYSLELDSDPSELAGRDLVTFLVMRAYDPNPERPPMPLPPR
jgi:hypothetical protein